MKKKKPAEDGRELTRAVTERFVVAMHAVILKSKRDKKGPATVKAFAESIGANGTNFWQIEDKSMNRNVTLEMCCAICKVHGIDANWLLLEVGEMDKAALDSKLDRMDKLLDLTNVRLNELEKKTGIKSGTEPVKKKAKRKN